MLESHAAAPSPFDVPRSLRSAILARVEGLAETARAILEAASIFANDIDAASLPHVCERNVREIDESLAAASLAQLIEPVDAGKRTFRFRHALAREVVYRSLIVPQARALHGRLADYLDGSGDDVAALAYHRWSARDTQRGPAACEASGDRAMSLASTADAAIEYVCALELASGDLDALERIASKAVRALYLCGRGEDAAGVCLRIASELERFERYARAAAMRLAAVNAAHWAGRADDAAAMLDAIEAGTSVREDASLRAEVLIARARLAASAGDRAALHALLERRGALSLTPLQDVRLALFEGLHAYLAGDFAAMERASRASVARSAALGFHDQSIVALSNLGVALDRQGKAREATPFLDRSVAVARELGDLRRLEIALANRVDLAIELGDLATARERLAEAAAAIELSFTGRRLAAECYFARVTGSDAAQLFEEFRRLPAAGQSMLFGPCAANLAWCFAVGDVRQREFFEPLVSAEPRTRDHDAAYLYAAASLGSNAEADAALTASASLAGGAPRIRAIGDLVAARVASRRGADRRALARRAAGVFDRMGYVVWHAHALDLAGETRRAVAMLREHGYGAEAERLANGIAHPAAERAGTPLSSREREIARLVARGLTNREIGERLGVAHRTVETHVQNAFRKLGVNSRMQLARVMDEPSRH